MPTPDAIPPRPASPVLLLARASVPPRLFREPAPAPAALGLAAAAALCAPDHGALRPWRFVLVQGKARRGLGDVLAASLALRAPGTPSERLEVKQAKPFRAPMVAAIGASLRHDRPGVPVWEQEASAAAGTMAFLVALETQGFGGVWLSSDAVHDPAVKAALGSAATNALLGWLYLGTPDAGRPRPERPRPEGLYRACSPTAAPHEGPCP